MYFEARLGFGFGIYGGPDAIVGNSGKQGMIRLFGRAGFADIDAEGR